VNADGRTGLVVPAVVRTKALVVGAGPWLHGLAGLIASMEQEWSISVGRCYQDATEALVAEATLADGTLAVLKLRIPGPDNDARNEVTVLRLARGDGCVRLLRADPERGALLLERLGRPLHELGLPLAQRLEILCAAAARVWRPAAGCGLPTGADKGRWLTAFITATWEELGRPCSERAVGYALACAADRIAAHDDARAVLVHGDVHKWNALQADAGFKLVDPDGLLAEPEYDLGVLMREDPAVLLASVADSGEGDKGAADNGAPRGMVREKAWERAGWLARRCGLDVTAIWQWGVVERVSTGLLATKIGLQPVGREMLAVADRICDE
jgi:streptomycin 6-kinase